LCLHSRPKTMLRVVNSLGPLFSSSKIISSNSVNRVDESSLRVASALDDIDNAFKQSRVSCKIASSCSSLSQILVFRHKLSTRAYEPPLNIHTSSKNFHNCLEPT